MDMQTSLEVSGLSISFGGLKAVDNMSLTVNYVVIIVFLGKIVCSFFVIFG